MFEKINFSDVVKETNKILENICSCLQIDLLDLLRDGDNKQTSANFTKFINTFLIQILKNHINKNYNGKLKISNNSDYDILFNNMEIEIKCTKSRNGWTGNRSSNKKGYHLLIYYDLNDSYFIDDISLFFVDINKLTNSFWKYHNRKNSSFSNLKIHNLDVEKVKIIRGNIIKKKKWSYPVLEEK